MFYFWEIFYYFFNFKFFVIVTPIGFLMKILKKDLLNLKFNKEKTYWLKKNELKSKMKDQF